MWRPVTEDEPPDYEWVLTWRPKVYEGEHQMNVCFRGRRTGGGWYWAGGGMHVAKGEYCPTFWQPLPSSPMPALF